MDTAEMNEFEMQAHSAKYGFYPVVIHKPCRATVITGGQTMGRVLKAMEDHVCD